MSLISGASRNGYLRSADFGASRPSAYSLFVIVRCPAVPSSGYVGKIAVAGDSADFPNDHGDLAIVWSHPGGSARGAAELHTTGSSYSYATFSTLSANTWYRLAAVYDGSNVIAYKDGTAITTTGATVSAAAPSDWYSSALADSALVNGEEGEVARVCYWDTALSQADVTQLQLGVSPLKIKGANLKSYWQCVRNTNGLIRPGSTTANLTVGVQPQPLSYP